MLPFSVFLRGKRPYYYVQFKNDETGAYLPAISTKKSKYDDAVRQAWAWYRTGILYKNAVLDIKTYSLRDSIRRASLTAEDAEFIIDELKQRGFVVSCIFAGAVDSVRFADFLSEFWDWERSPYVREKLRAEHSIHKRHVKQMLRDIKKYWIPFFPSVLLGDFLSADLDRFVDHLSNVRHGDNKPLSNVRKNCIIKAGTIPLRWAYKKRKIEIDITRDLILFSDKTAVRPILTPEQAASVFTQEWSDLRCKVANMTAMVTGLRAGELQGLQLDDIGDGFLRVRHSWNCIDKLKTTKTNTERIVELPFPFVLQSLRYIASLNPHENGTFVFWSSRLGNKPMEQRLFVLALRDALVYSGFNKSEIMTFHAWRHFFTTYMRPRLEDDKLLQSQTGHKTIAVMERYADHLRSGDRDKIRDAQLEVFSALLPSG